MAGSELTALPSSFLSLTALRKQVRKLLPINSDRIWSEMLEQTEKAEEIAALHAQVSAQAKSLSNEVDRVKAKVYMDKRNSIPKPTEKEAEALRELDGHLHTLKDMQVEAEAGKQYMNDMARAFDERGNLLTQIRKLADAEASNQ